MFVIIEARCAACKTLLSSSVTPDGKATQLWNLKCDEHPNYKFTLTPIITSGEKS